MNRLIALGLFILVLAMGAAIWLWLARSTPDAPVAPLRSADYAMPEAWAARPATPPAAVWEDGWAVDVFLVMASAARAPAPTKSLAARDAQAIADAASLSEGLASIGPVYAPVYAASDISGDLSRAFESYLASDNRGRAFVIATDEPLPASLLAMISADTMVRERFAGVLRLSSASDADQPFDAFADGVSPSDYCPERLSTPQGCVATIVTSRKGGRRVIVDTPPLGGVVLSGLLEWLETNAVQLAEPLGDLEEVAIIDIRRPGETGTTPESEGQDAQP